MATMRSDSLTRSSARSANTVSPSASAAATASAGISSIERSASSPAIVVPRRRDARDAHAADRLAQRVCRPARSSIVRAHRHQRVERAGPGRVEAHVLDDHVAAGDGRGGDEEERRRRQIARDDDRNRAQPSVPAARIDDHRPGRGVDRRSARPSQRSMRSV